MLCMHIGGFLNNSDNDSYKNNISLLSSSAILYYFTGCPVYNPPLRGATTCYLNSTVNLMFCSVYCDHNFEFLATPHNPYFCGPTTEFQWIDATQRPNVFPECTGKSLTQTVGLVYICTLADICTDKRHDHPHYYKKVL